MNSKLLQVVVPCYKVNSFGVIIMMVILILVFVDIDVYLFFCLFAREDCDPYYDLLCCLFMCVIYLSMMLTKFPLLFVLPSLYFL